MEDFKLDIIIDQGPNARSVRLNLPRFTLIGATTGSGLLTAPLLTRFAVRERLDYYQAAQLHEIVVRSARLLNVEIELNGAHEIARRSRGTPRIANNLLRRVRDYAQVRSDGRITVSVADQALAMLEIDQHGRLGRLHDQRHPAGRLTLAFARVGRLARGRRHCRVGRALLRRAGSKVSGIGRRIHFPRTHAASGGGLPGRLGVAARWIFRA